MISLEKMASTAPDLIGHYQVAKDAFTGLRAAVYLAIDVSGSMETLFAHGAVQKLAEQVLSASATLDDDGIVPVFFFNTDVQDQRDIVLGQHQGFMNDVRARGGTCFSPVMDAIVSYHLDNNVGDPALVIFQTDGDQSDVERTRMSVISSSELPIYWQFFGMGSDQFPRLERHNIDPAGRSIINNTGLIIDPCEVNWRGKHQSTLTDQEIYSQIATGYRAWLVSAQRAGIVA